MTAPAQNGPALEIRDLVKTFGASWPWTMSPSR